MHKLFRSTIESLSGIHLVEQRHDGCARLRAILISNTTNIAFAIVATFARFAGQWLAGRGARDLAFGGVWGAERCGVNSR